MSISLLIISYVICSSVLLLFWYVFEYGALIGIGWANVWVSAVLFAYVYFTTYTTRTRTTRIKSWETWGDSVFNHGSNHASPFFLDSLSWPFSSLMSSEHVVYVRSVVRKSIYEYVLPLTWVVWMWRTLDLVFFGVHSLDSRLVMWIFVAIGVVVSAEYIHTQGVRIGSYSISSLFWFFLWGLIVSAYARSVLFGSPFLSTVLWYWIPSVAVVLWLCVYLFFRTCSWISASSDWYVWRDVYSRFFLWAILLSVVRGLSHFVLTRIDDHTIEKIVYREIEQFEFEETIWTEAEVVQPVLIPEVEPTAKSILSSDTDSDTSNTLSVLDASLEDGSSELWKKFLDIVDSFAQDTQVEQKQESCLSSCFFLWECVLLPQNSECGDGETVPWRCTIWRDEVQRTCLSE